MGALKFSSLSEQVYAYLRTEMINGNLTPGSTINIGEIASELGISKTPLRDALIHLELEGFVTIIPRRGVLVNELKISDVKNAYEAVGLIEAFIVEKGIEHITSSHIQELQKLNEIMIKDIQNNDFSRIFETNLEFHSVYVDSSDNELLQKFILPIKHRLYDFPRHNFIPEWEMRNCEEHRQFIEQLKKGNGKEAGSILRDKHWSYEYQKDFIYAFYKKNVKMPD
ncbi:GntR family transcriptional regulator [Desulfogranum marinum]|uniref:GntR family transcriptional regulator n=1 Tax=Desulfogranum marinum TaxID=453220 RepID=UPI0019655AE6|nr:GntR family transcriptional regulator [Desulfogranum marinum]MBM9511509.1 GntR family transcriptional regulator [Desulfogranum marinum]